MWERHNDQTYLDISRTKEQLFDRWCNKVDGDFDYFLRQLIVLEDFKSCISSDIKTPIVEQNAPTLGVAARMADEYALTHKVNFSITSAQ